MRQTLVIADGDHRHVFRIKTPDSPFRQEIDPVFRFGHVHNAVGEVEHVAPYLYPFGLSIGKERHQSLFRTDEGYSGVATQSAGGPEHASVKQTGSHIAALRRLEAVDALGSSGYQAPSAGRSEGAYTDGGSMAVVEADPHAMFAVKPDESPVGGKPYESIVRTLYIIDCKA